jgi:hypothetical protein
MKKDLLYLLLSFIRFFRHGINFGLALKVFIEKKIKSGVTVEINFLFRKEIHPI